MPAPGRWFTTVERVLAGVLFAWLMWLPLPFGSNVENARIPLVVAPLALCAATALIRIVATHYRTSAPDFPRAWRIWTIGSLLLLAIAVVQLVPLPPALLHALSPRSDAIWRQASSVAALAGVPTPSAHPITVDPHATAFELFRLLALAATFHATALLVRNHIRRMILASAIAASALFQTIYGVREAALGRYAIWGWVNTLIFDRVTGTFVNPNHFAHYVAIALPMALFIGAIAWRDAAPAQVPLRVRVVQLVERRLVLFVFAAIVAIGCAAALLLSQSRGGLLALAAGLLITGARLPGRRAAKLGLAAAAGLLVLASLVALLGQERTLRRFDESDAESALAGRRISASAAVETWKHFPILGSGLGTFERVVAIVQREGAERTYHHAHDDYLEIAATGGTLAFIIAIGSLFAGYVALVRQTVGAAASTLKWKRRAFQAAALASLTTAMVHALFDFNFFIPANPATLAAILGAAVTVTIHDDNAIRR